MKKMAVVALLAALVAAFVVPTAFAAGWSYSKYCYIDGYVVSVYVNTWKDYKGDHLSGSVQLGDWDYENNNGFIYTDDFTVEDANILSQLQTAAIGGYWVYVTTDMSGYYGISCKKYEYRGKAISVSFSEPRSYDYEEGYGDGYGKK